MLQDEKVDDLDDKRKDLQRSANRLNDLMLGLLAGWKLHPLWNTPWIPLLFLISCVGMGYAGVVWESAVSRAGEG